MANSDIELKKRTRSYFLVRKTVLRLWVLIWTPDLGVGIYGGYWEHKLSYSLNVDQCDLNKQLASNAAVSRVASSMRCSRNKRYYGRAVYK